MMHEHRNKKLIQIVHFSSKPGGIELLMPKIINEFNKSDIKVYVLRPSQNNSVNVYKNLDIQLKYGSNSNIIGFYQLVCYALRNRFDVFHVFNIGPYYLFILKLVGVKKIVYSIRGTIYWKNAKQKFLRKLFWRLSLSKTVKLFANSEFSRSVFLNEVSNRYPIEVLYNPIFSESLYPNLAKGTSNELKIIYIGRLANGKNLFKWLDIAATIRNHVPKVKFRIYGDGLLKNELTEYVETLKLTKAVDFMGYTKDVAAAYQQADVMIFISEFESFGNVVVESVLCGTPVIVSAIPSMKEIFINYPEFLVELDENLEQNVLKKVENIDYLKSLVPKARKEFMERFSLELHIQKLEKIYNSFNN